MKRCILERQGLRFSRSRKKWVRSFDNVLFGHSFALAGECIAIPEKTFYCCLCGGRLKHVIIIKRDDDELFPIGKTCLEKTGLIYPERGLGHLKPEQVDPPPKPKIVYGTEEIEKYLA
jgi:hypothetical protein